MWFIMRFIRGIRVVHQLVQATKSTFWCATIVNKQSTVVYVQNKKNPTEHTYIENKNMIQQSPQQ